MPFAAVREGIDLLHRGRFMDSHEAFERAWRASSGPDRSLWQALAQLAAAFVHAERARWRPAARLLGRVRHHLEGVPARHGGVDVEALREAAAEWHRRLLAAADGAPWQVGWRPIVRVSEAPADPDDPG